MRIGYVWPAYPCNVHCETAYALLRDALWAERNGHTLVPRYWTISSLPMARNRAVQWARDEDFDLLVSFDRDNACQGSALERMLGVMREHDASAVFLAYDSGSDFLVCEPARPGEIYEGECGQGISLIDIRRTASVPLPWWVDVFSDDGCTRICEGDVFCCQLLKQHGHRVIVDCRGGTAHYKEKGFAL